MDDFKLQAKTHPEDDPGVPVFLCIEYMYWRYFIL